MSSSLGRSPSRPDRSFPRVFGSNASGMGVLAPSRASAAARVTPAGAGLSRLLRRFAHPSRDKSQPPPRRSRQQPQGQYLSMTSEFSCACPGRDTNVQCVCLFLMMETTANSALIKSRSSLPGSTRQSIFRESANRRHPVRGRAICLWAVVPAKRARLNRARACRDPVIHGRRKCPSRFDHWISALPRRAKPGSLGRNDRQRCLRRQASQAASSNASNPLSNSIGRGGQPRMCRSTGITCSTPPTTA